MRLALGLSYRGQAYHGWQSQPDGRTVQDALETALAAFAAAPVANYVGFTVSGNTVFVSGQLPFKDGKLPVTGRLGAGALL